MFIHWITVVFINIHECFLDGYFKCDNFVHKTLLVVNKHFALQP